MKQANLYIPLFNSNLVNDELDSSSLVKDEQGLYRSLEMVLLPHERVEIAPYNDEIVRVSTPDHPFEKSFFTFKDFFECSKKIDSTKSFLEPKAVIESLRSYEQLPYVWGGNWILDSQGEAYLKSLFKGKSAQFIQNLKYLFSGLDCSGLLYAATLGTTPRNTSELVNFGNRLEIEGLTNTQLLELMKPLDLIVWKGHVVVFLNINEVIESRNPQGVVITNPIKRLEEIRLTRQPSDVANNQTFVIQRW